MNFPDKKKGDQLSHSHVNQLNAAARESSRLKIGSGLRGWGHHVAAPTPWIQRLAIVVDPEAYENEQEDTCPDMALIRFRYFDPEEVGEGDCECGWVTDETEGTSACLDYKAAGMIKPEVGTVLTVWWHEQRGYYVPIAPHETFLVCRFSGDWDVGDEKTVERLNDNDTWTVAEYPNEFEAVNLAVDVTLPPSATYRKCGIQRYRSKWVLMWVEGYCGET
jgi:hypothetical protein